MPEYPTAVFAPPATEDEVRSSAVQFVRKVSGFPQPSAANEAAFERAIDAIAANTRVLMEELVTAAPKRDREVETAKAKAKAALRYAKR